MTAKHDFWKSLPIQQVFSTVITQLEKVSIFAVIAVTLSNFRAITGQSSPFCLWITHFFMTDLSTGLSAMSFNALYGNEWRYASRGLGIGLWITPPDFAFISVSR